MWSTDGPINAYIEAAGIELAVRQGIAARQAYEDGYKAGQASMGEDWKVE
jgi:hypothetical protein